MIEKQLSLPYSIQQFLRFQGFRKTKNDKILLWAQKNGLIVLENGKILVVKLPNFIRGMRALPGMPKIETPVLILPDEVFNILDLASILELPQRLLIPVIPLNQIRLRSLCKIMYCLNSDEVSDVFFDTKRSVIQSGTINLLKNIPSPRAVLPSMKPQTWDKATTKLTPISLFGHFDLSSPISENVFWPQLLGSLPTNARQSIGLQLVRIGFIEEVEELKILSWEKLPNKSLAAISSYGYLAIWNDRKKARYYKKFLGELGFPIGETALFEALFKDPYPVCAEFISAVGAAHLLETIASSQTSDQETVIGQWLQIILDSTLLEGFRQNIILGTLCHLSYFAGISSGILTASIRFPYPSVLSLEPSLCNYYLDFIEDNPSLLPSILKGANCNLYQTTWAPIIRLRLFRIAVKSGQYSLCRQLLDNDPVNNEKSVDIRQLIRVGKFFSGAFEFSNANELYASVPSELNDGTILFERILNHLCQYQLQQAASLLENPLSSEMRPELKESLMIRLLRSEGRLSEAERRTTDFLSSPDLPTNPEEVIFESAQIQSANAQYNASLEILESLALQGMPIPWFHVIEFETQLQQWCRDGRLLNNHGTLSYRHYQTEQCKYKINLGTLLVSALSTTDPEPLAQECFQGYAGWDLPYLSYQHWFLLCGIALALCAGNQSLASDYLSAWWQDPWIGGRCSALGISIPEIDISSAEDISFWKGLLRTWGPEVPAHQRWSELFSTISGEPDRY